MRLFLIRKVISNTYNKRNKRKKVAFLELETYTNRIENFYKSDKRKKKISKK